MVKKIVAKVVKSSKKSYDKMSKNERKVAIAKDVIANLHVLKIRSDYGYVVTDNDNDYDVGSLLSFGITPKQIAQKAKVECSVCARGAMMLCKIDKFNNFDFGGVESIGCINQENTFEALQDAFSDDELCEIEYAFEDNWSDIDSDNDRLRAIMQNIIDHKGDFKSEVEYTVS